MRTVSRSSSATAGTATRSAGSAQIASGAETDVRTMNRFLLRGRLPRLAHSNGHAVAARNNFLSI